MSLQFIIGRAGSGKSTYCLEQIRSSLLHAPMGDPLILLVPEQASFQAEYKLVTSPGLAGIERAQVLSFRRMAFRILQETGGLNRQPIDDIGKKMLLYRVLEQNKDSLRFLRTGTGGRMGVVDVALDLINEFKRYALTPDALAEALANRTKGENSLLEDKLHDIALVYHRYESELTARFFDAEDILSLLAVKASDSAYLRTASVWIDEFHGFTPQEMTVVRSLLRHCREVKITLCLDRTYAAGEKPHELNLFHPTAVTMAKLLKIAEEDGVEVLETVRLNDAGTRTDGLSGHDGPVRFQENPQLAFFERHFARNAVYCSKINDEQIKDNGIALHAAMNRRAEIEGAAREMVRLAREEGCRWRDIAVLVRESDVYLDQTARILEDYGIPFFLDQKRSVHHHPLIEFVRSAVEIVIHHWPYDAVFRCVKTDFLYDGTNSPSLESRTAFDELENYVLAFGIRGNRWTDGKPWAYHLSNGISDASERHRAEQEALLARVNAARQAIVRPLAAFERMMKQGQTVREYVSALYELLEEVDAPGKLEHWSAASAEAGNPESAREHVQVWDSVMNVLDQMVEMMGRESIPLDLFAGLLDTGLESVRIGLVPPSLDQVLVGNVDRTRSPDVQYMFILGVNDGIFPQKIKENGLLSEPERERLIESGVELAPGSRRRLLDEQFIIYSVTTTPRRRLYLSYPIADEEGKSLLPAEVIRKVKRMFPGTEERFLFVDPPPALPPDTLAMYAMRPRQALSHLLVQLREWLRGTEIAPMWWDVYNWLSSQAGWKDYLRKQLYGLMYTNEARTLSPDTSRRLYGTQLVASVSRMEKFAACPFSHFASYALRLRERKMFRLAAPDIGQLFHAALSLISGDLDERGWAELDKERGARLAEQAVDTLVPRMQGEILLSSRRYAYISRKLKAIVGRAVDVLSEHARRGQFSLVGVEIAFGRGEALPPLEFMLSNGCSMEVAGRIDRVDAAVRGNELLIRIIDYKSSETSLRLADVYYGIALQMLTYLDVVLTHSEKWLGRPAKPAGALYFHVHQPLLATKNDIEPTTAERELFKKFQMKGYVTADEDVVRMMDNEMAQGKSDIVPVALKKDGGFYKYASVVTEEQWASLRRYVRRTIRDIGERITQGDVAVRPYRSGKRTPCTFCEYRSLCQFDVQFEGNSYYMHHLKHADQLWNQIVEEQGREGGASDE